MRRRSRATSPRARPTAPTTISSDPRWAAPARASGATCRSSTGRARAARRPDVAEPAHGQPRADDAVRVPGPPPPSTSLVAAWLQFMIRDWFSHGHGPGERRWEIPLRRRRPVAASGRWSSRGRPATRRGPPDSTGPADLRQHRDALVGRLADLRQQPARSRRRSARGIDGKLGSLDDGRLDLPERAGSSPTAVPGFWLGLSVMGDLFIREHNAICDRFAAEYPAWADEELFQRARLINAALLAKIHTVEWTPAVISHPDHGDGDAGELVGAGRGAARPRRRAHQRAARSISGIPGSETQPLRRPVLAHRGVHRGLPDASAHPRRLDASARADRRPAARASTPFRELTGPQTEDAASERLASTDLLYSFGTRASRRGDAAQLPARPAGLRAARRASCIDLAATDILRSRELGVPALQRVPPAAAPAARRRASRS